jgi:hypothetical protein
MRVLVGTSPPESSRSRVSVVFGVAAPPRGRLVPCRFAEGMSSMAGAAPQVPELLQPYQAPAEDDFHISEFATDHPGALSPFGPDVEFPLPLERLNYRHPTRAERPHLAGD